MQKNREIKQTSKKKLILRKESIKALDNVDLSLVTGGQTTIPAVALHAQRQGSLQISWQ